jgi:hypothetical protein
MAGVDANTTPVAKIVANRLSFTLRFPIQIKNGWITIATNMVMNANYNSSFGVPNAIGVSCRHVFSPRSTRSVLNNLVFFLRALRELRGEYITCAPTIIACVT